MLNWLKRRFESRNMARSTAVVEYSGQGKKNAPIYKNWTIAKAVKEGFKSNTWVYRSVVLITDACSSVPWSVYRDDSLSDPLPDHALTKLLKAPNPNFSKQDMFEMLVSWLELSGNSYFYKTQVDAKTVELWPISPDLIVPVTPAKVDEWVGGYKLTREKNKRKITFTADQIIHHKYFNPADALLGIGPLEIAGPVVDIDNDQKDFNKDAAQNRGIIDGVFAFKKDIPDQDTADALRDRIEESYKKKRKNIVLGSEAKYIRTAMTPTEMDFTQSRKDNRDEIFITFGIPPALGGSMDASTYNNYQVSEWIFWTATIIPKLKKIADTFNLAFRDEKKEQEQIAPMLNKVPAIRQMVSEKSKIAERLSKAGIPVQQINQILELGVKKYKGWDQPYRSSSSGNNKNPDTTEGE